ncbi:MAG: hypothetical protein CM1200mP8_0360 [Chloroflexota bacterium]|nr:MAG: hypothetical protein CM1200mP8_0360 [Chloroflexota bacterium]
MVSKSHVIFIGISENAKTSRRVNFDWKDVDGVLKKISEEISEFNKSETDADREHELGDILFSIVNLCRWNNIDAESALRKSNKRFENVSSS